jgi:hypothetical protein
MPITYRMVLLCYHVGFDKIKKAGLSPRPYSYPDAVIPAKAGDYFMYVKSTVSKLKRTAVTCRP